jgi:hypothetical protein
MNNEQDPRNKRYYHGGDDGLLVGQYIEPPNVTGKDNIGGIKPLQTWIACLARNIPLTECY